jgi:hypothetical protein
MQDIRIGKVPYFKIFEPPRVLGRVLAQDDFSYLTEAPVGLKGGDVVLHISCQTLTVSHIPYLAQQVLTRLGIEFTSVGGPENCCGAYHWHMGEEEHERQIAAMTLAGFRRLKPVTVASTCPDCDASFRRHLGRQHKFEYKNVAQIFVEHLERLKPLLKHPVNKRVALHAHEAHPQNEDAARIRQVLAAVPGLELVEAEHSCGPGSHCVKQFNTVKPELTKAMFEEAQALELDAIVVPYHGCYRQHFKQQLNYGIAVQHYLSILAESMGIPYEEPFKELRLLDDIDKAVEMLRPKFERFNYKEEDIRSYIEATIYV